MFYVKVTSIFGTLLSVVALNSEEKNSDPFIFDLNAEFDLKIDSLLSLDVA